LLTYRFFIFDKNGDTATRMIRALPDDNAALAEAKKIIRDGAIACLLYTSDAADE